MVKNILVKKEKPKADLLKPVVNISTGDFVIDKSGRIYKVGEKIVNGKRGKYKMDFQDGFVLLHGSDKRGWSHYGDIELERFQWDFLKIDETDSEKLEKKIFEKVLSLKPQEPEPEKEVVTETGLVKFDKEYLLSLKKIAEERKKEFSIMERVLERKRNELIEVVNKFELQVEKINKVVATIEVYLGIQEEIEQIADGERANIAEPICLRQMLLFMDEEVGDFSDGGLDFERIEDFDEWLLKDNNFVKLLPEKKGIVAMRIRRYDKDYLPDNPFANALLNEGNHKTYFLIRNGECLFRIWSLVHVSGRLFPQREELKKIMAVLEKEKGGQSLFFDDEEKKDALYYYKQNMILLQGLLDRTQVFSPMPRTIQLFKPETCADLIRFVYDDEAALTEGKKYWREWHEEINSKLVRGSRVIFAGFPYREVSDEYGVWRRRYVFKPYGNSPEYGVYSIVKTVPVKDGEFDENTEKLVCHYNPKDTVYSNRWFGEGSHERKKSIPFYLYREDEFILNYDLVSLEDVDYYLQSRVDRENYLSMIPTLWWLKKERAKELVWEKGFVDNLLLRIVFDNKEELEKIILEAIGWWKNKVIWKRPLRKDDAKALRMITKRVKKIVEEKKVV